MENLPTKWGFFTKIFALFRYQKLKNVDQKNNIQYSSVIFQEELRYKGPGDLEIKVNTNFII